MNVFYPYLRRVFPLVVILCAAGCSTFEEKPEIASNPQDLYNEGVTLLSKDQVLGAVEKFETIEREHPESPLASQAQVRRAYGYYLEGQYISAVLTIDEFVKQYPSHDSTPYMYYLKGLCFYDQIVDPGRDQELTHKAVVAFNDLKRRFPDSKYSKDAQFKLDYAQNNLAGKEMDIGRFYQNNKQLIAALNRYKTVVEEYQTTIFISEALYRIVEIHYAMGDTNQAKRYAAVLGHNYPDSDWYQKAYGLVVDGSFEGQTPWYKKSIRSIW